MWGDTRFYSSDGVTVFCGHCIRVDCGRHYRNKDKYPWRYYKGHSTAGLQGYDGECCDYESPHETQIILEKHRRRVILQGKIEKLEKKIRELRERVDEI